MKILKNTPKPELDPTEKPPRIHSKKAQIAVLFAAILCFSSLAALPMAALEVLGGLHVSESVSSNDYVENKSEEELTEDEMLANIDSLYKQLLELDATKEELTGKIDKAKSEISTLLEAKSLLDEQAAVIESKIEALDEVIADYDSLIAAKQSQIDDMQSVFANKYQTFLDRLAQSYEEGTPSVLEIIFNSESFIEILTSIERMNDILTYDTSLMNSLEVEINELIRERTVLEGYKSEKQSAEDELLAQKQELAAKIEESLQYISELEKSQSLYESYISQATLAEELINDQIEKAIEEYNKNFGNTAEVPLEHTKLYKELYVKEEIVELMEKGIIQKGSEYYEDGADYIMPVRFADYAAGYLSSYFGWRTYVNNYGVTVTSNHKGIDLAVAYASEIYASKSGTVIEADYSSAYGNIVVILHDDGTQTRYAHCSKFLVEEGEYVLQGETVALVGSTGNATGNCCHFEVRLYESNTWNPKDPLNYVTVPGIND